MFSTIYDTYQIIVSPFVHIFDIIAFIVVELEEPKIGIWGKGLIVCKCFQDKYENFLCVVKSICPFE